MPDLRGRRRPPRGGETAHRRRGPVGSRTGNPHERMSRAIRRQGRVCAADRQARHAADESAQPGLIRLFKYRKPRVHGMLCALAFAATTANARLTEINTVAIEPFADGTSYGATGAYERVRGIFKGELDPLDARNKVIVNL